MWSNGWVDWVILLSGYVFALGIFRFLGGFAAAGDAFRRWGGNRARQRGTVS